MNNGLHIYFVRVVKAQGQFISVNAKFYRVAHRGELDHRHLRAGNHAHVKEMLAQRTGSSHPFDNAGLSRLQILECHCFFTFSSSITSKPQFFAMSRHFCTSLSLRRAGLWQSALITTFAPLPATFSQNRKCG